MLWPDDELSPDEREQEEADAVSYYADMQNMPSDTPLSVEEIADQAQQYDVEVPF